MSADAAKALAQRQLDAYNVADLDVFSACYADDVIVLDAEGAPTMSGRAELRERYAQLFARFRDVRADLIVRVTCGSHAIDHERWSRVDRETGEASAGEILARYTVRDGLIAVVQFWR